MDDICCAYLFFLYQIGFRDALYSLFSLIVRISFSFNTPVAPLVIITILNLFVLIIALQAAFIIQL